MKKVLTIIVSLFVVISVFSQAVPRQISDRVAQNVFSERLFISEGHNKFAFEPQPLEFSNNNEISFYAYVCVDRPGYIIIAGDYSANPIFGYSFTSTWDDALTTPVFRDMLDNFSAQIEFARTNKVNASSEAVEEWAYYSSENFNKSGKDLKNLAPILQTSWNQGCYYNDLCPEDSQGPCGRVWAGCVATAMGQVMKYHNWPPQGEGSNLYLTWGGYGTLNANFGQTTYDWSVMQNSLNSTTENFEVARLLYHLGISVNMNYGWDGSGANSQTSATAWINNFKYASYLMHIEKDLFSDANWGEMLQVEVQSGRPVYYRGYSSAGGHAFVCDGYQGNNYHFNMGWGGSGNGFYSLSNVGGFSSGQAAIFGVEPNYTGPQYCAETTVLTAQNGTISDGSGTTRYANNTNCKWLIQPEDAGAVLLQFNYLNTEPTFDRILIYEGVDENGWLVAEISGFNAPTTPIVAMGGSMFVWFLSDELNAAGGWEADYSIWATQINDNINTEVSIIPNPASHNVQIQLNQSISEDVVVIVYDMNGKQVIRSVHSMQNGFVNLDVSHLPEGIYSADLISSSVNLRSQKIVISR